MYIVINAVSQIYLTNAITLLILHSLFFTYYSKIITNNRTEFQL